LRRLGQRGDQETDEDKARSDLVEGAGIGRPVSQT